MNSRQQSQAPSLFPALQQARKAHCHATAEPRGKELRHRTSVPQQLIISYVCLAPETFSHSPFHFYILMNSWAQYLLKVSSSPFLQAPIQARVLSMVPLPALLPLPPFTTKLLRDWLHRQLLSPSFSPPTRFASNTVNMNVKKLRNNQYVFQVSCWCLFNISCYI